MLPSLFNNGIKKLEIFISNEIKLIDRIIKFENIKKIK